MANPKLHELLAAENTRKSGTELLLAETRNKFQKPDSFFKGQVKTLSMLEDTPANKAAEAGAREEKALPTTVADTLSYMLSHWAGTEDLLFQKNKSNQSAIANVELNGRVILAGIPVDELMGLENRLGVLRGVIQLAPTLDASIRWKPAPDMGHHVWVSENDEENVKTDKIMTAVVLYDATEKHPAQVKEVAKDVVVGKFITKRFSGAMTTLQKADAMALIDNLIAEVKKARVRANQVDACTERIGNVIFDLIMAEVTKK